MEGKVIAEDGVTTVAKYKKNINDGTEDGIKMIEGGKRKEYKIENSIETGIVIGKDDTKIEEYRINYEDGVRTGTIYDKNYVKEYEKNDEGIETGTIKYTNGYANGYIGEYEKKDGIEK